MMFCEAMVPLIGLVCNPSILNPKKALRFSNLRLGTNRSPKKKGGPQAPIPTETRDSVYCSWMFRALMSFAYFSISFLK